MPDVVGSAYVRIRAIADKVGDDIAKAVNDPKNKKSLDKNIDKLFEGLGKKGKIFWAGLLGAPALGPVIQVLGAYIGQAISLVSALGPAIAVSAGVGVSAMLAFKQASGVFDLAMKTKTPMLDRYKAVTKGLKDELAAPIQNNILPALGGAYARLFPVIRGGAIQTSAVLGRLIDQTSRFVASPMISGRVQTIMRGNNAVISAFGAALRPLIDILTRLLVIVQPYAIEFARWAAGLAAVADKATIVGDRTGKLAAFFGRASGTAKLLGDIGKNALSGIWNILKAARPAGDSLLASLDAITRRFADWTRSASGENKINKYFTDSRAIVVEVNKIVTDLFKAFGKNLHYSGLDALLHTLAGIDRFVNQFIPPLVAAFSANGPGLGKVFGQFAQILTQLAQSGMFGQLATELHAILNIIGPIIASPLGSTLIKWGIEATAFAKITSIIPGSTKLASLAVKGLTGDLLRLIPAVEGTSKIGSIIKGIGIAMKGAFAFLLANPIILLVVAVIAGLVLMYFKVKWFRDFVNAAWRDIKIWSVDLWHGLQTAFQAIGAAAVWLWQNVLRPAFAGIQVAFGVLVDAFQVAWRFYLHPLFEMWQLEFRILVDVLRIGATAMGYAIAIFAGLLVLWWRIAIKPVWDGFSLAVRFLWTYAVQPVLQQTGTLFTATGHLLQAVYHGVIQPLWTAFAAAVLFLWRNGVQPAFSGIRAAFAALGSALQAVYRGVIAPIWSLMVRGIDLVVNHAKTVLGGIKTLFGDAFSAAAGPFKMAINAMIDILNDAIGAINHLSIDVPDVPGLPHRGEHIGLHIDRVPHLAHGGTVQPKSGGTLARLAEAGRPERIEPLDSQGLSARDRAIIAELSGGGRPPISIALTVAPLPGMDTRQFARYVAEFIGEEIASLG